MPTYDYHCTKCGNDFSIIEHIATHEASKAKCPSCKSKKVERVFGNVMVKTKKKS